MLPDLPEIKNEVAGRLNSAFKARVNVLMGVLNEAPRCVIKEGNRVLMLRENGSADETKMQESSAESVINYKEVPDLDFKERILRMEEAALNMAEQISKNAFAQIDAAVNRVGNVVSGKGRMIDADALLSVLEKIQIDFDEDGTHSPLSLVVSPSMKEHADNAIVVLHTDPAYKQRHADLMNKKRMEWRDREANRKLVG